MTDKNLFPNMTEADRVRALEQQAYSTATGYSFTKFFTEVEVTAMQKDLSQVLIKLDGMEEAFKETKTAFNDSVKPLKEQIKDLISSIKHKSCMIVDDVFMFDNQEEKIMAVYDRDGNLIETRPLRPDERQLHILHATGSDTPE